MDLAPDGYTAPCSLFISPTQGFLRTIAASLRCPGGLVKGIPRATVLSARSAFRGIVRASVALTGRLGRLLRGSKALVKTLDPLALSEIQDLDALWDAWGIIRLQRTRKRGVKTGNAQLLGVCSHRACSGWDETCSGVSRDAFGRGGVSVPAAGWCLGARDLARSNADGGLGACGFARRALGAERTWPGHASEPVALPAAGVTVLRVARPAPPSHRREATSASRARAG